MDKILHQLIGSLSHYLQGFIHTRRCRISSINSTCQFSSTVCSFPGWPRKVWPQRSWVCWPRTIEPWCLGSSAKTWEKTWNVKMVVLKRKGIRAPKIYAKIQVKDLLVMGFIIDSKHVFQWHCIWCKVSEATKSKHLFSIRDRFRYLKENTFGPPGRAFDCCIMLHRYLSYYAGHEAQLFEALLSGDGHPEFRPRWCRVNATRWNTVCLARIVSGCFSISFLDVFGVKRQGN